MKMKAASTSTLILSLLTAIPYVAAHGFLWQISINGKAYEGNTPNGPTNPSIIRQVSDISPVKGTSNPSLNCGLSATQASQVGSANPGDPILIKWGGGGGQHWPHNTGPMMTYMASCGDTPCDQYDSQNAKWFKIDQAGRQSAGGDWVQQQIMNGSPANVSLPSNIAPGNYIIRHEIIALHLGMTMGGAEFYPSCTQITVGGNGNGAPTSSELVSFPGAYQDSDPGIYDPNIYDPTAPYTFPGPPIAAFVTSSSPSPPPPPSSGTATATSAASSTTSTGSPNNGTSSSTGTCRLKRRPSTSIRRPRHFSRIMRNLYHMSYH